MSIIKRVTLEQVTEALNRSKYGEIGKYAWQGFIENAQQIGFDYLVSKIIEKAKESSRVIPLFGATAIAIACLSKNPNDLPSQINGYLYSTHSFDNPDEGLKLFVEWAIFTGKEEDIREAFRWATTYEQEAGYYWVKTLLLMSQKEAIENWMDDVLSAAQKIESSFERAKAILEIYRASNYQKVLNKFFSIVDKGHSDPYINSRIHALEIPFSGSKHIGRIKDICRIRNPRIAESFAAIAAMTKEQEDLERAYIDAREISNNREHEIWGSLVRILAGID